MNIAMFVSEFPAVSTTFIYNQIAGLIRHGHTVTIFASKKGDNQTVQDVVKKYGLDQRVVYQYQDIPANKILRFLKLISMTFKNISHISLAKYLQCFNLKKYGKNAANFNIAYLYLSLLQKRDSYANHFDIIHCQFLTLCHKALLIQDLGLINGPIVASVRGYDITKNQHSIDYSEVFKRVHLFMPVSNSLKEKLIQKGCPEEHIAIHYSGIDVQAFSPQTAHKNSKTTQLLSVARLSEKKGLEYAIRAVSSLLKNGVALEYNIIGDGELKKDLTDLIDRLGCREYILIRGSQTQTVVREFLNQATIFIAPSVTAFNGDQEGIPNVIKEAMLFELPVVSTLHSGIPELVVDGHTGCLCAEKDADALAQNIQFLIDHPSIARQYGKNGKQSVLDSFDNEMLTKKLITLYEQVIRST